MTLNKVEVTNMQGSVLELPFGDISQGYLVKPIEGLDPVKATIVSSSFAEVDGTQYQSSRREARNLIIKMGLVPNHRTGAVRDLRAKLYKYFMPKSQVVIRFISDDMPDVLIAGMVESFDAPLFVKDPEATVSLMCFLPDFYDPTPVVISGTTVSDTTEFLIDYVGSIETGIQFQLKPNRPIDNFTIFHRPADNSLRSLDFGATLIAGDTLDISTISRSKYARLTSSGGNTSSILYGVSSYSNWIEMFPGPNYLRVYTGGAPIPYSITFTTKYGGL